MSELRKKLLYEKKNGYDTLTDAEVQELEAYSKQYCNFLDAGKTERECVATSVYLAETHGFREWDPEKDYAPGDKVYYVNRDKNIALAVIGEKPLSEGVRIAAAHVDSPRLDLKPRPLYEEDEQAYFKTHYYGGIRKYQWTVMPLALHGAVVLKNGEKLLVKIGDAPDDPQFVITDLLPHLAVKQGEKPLNEAISAETLNILVGGRPLAGDDGRDRVKLEVLRLLNERYGIVEEDFTSAELEAVPAYPAREIGFDRSFLGAYGHDDRSCGFAALHAILQTEKPEKTAICLLVDKEEIGSEGVTSMQSAAFDHFVSLLCRKQNVQLEDCWAKSLCLSADVTSAFDPGFPECYEKHNCARCNYGVGVSKYTGRGGKSQASDASAELMGYLRGVFHKNGVQWQTAEIGRTDVGGGGTVAKFVARRGIDVVDLGVPVLSMHAPFETVAKFDCYMTYRAIRAVFEDR